MDNHVKQRCTQNLTFCYWGNTINEAMESLIGPSKHQKKKHKNKVETHGHYHSSDETFMFN